MTKDEMVAMIETQEAQIDVLKAELRFLKVQLNANHRREHVRIDGLPGV